MKFSAKGQPEKAAGHIKKAGCGRSGPKAQERFRISGCEDKTGAE